jgi:RHS repeat-associated protein
MSGYRGVVCALLVALMCMGGAFAQANPNLEDGYKFYGTYHGSNIDTINTMNGNLMLHIPMPFTYPQRGGKIAPENLLTISSKAWSVQCDPPPPNSGAPPCYWSKGRGLAAGMANIGSGVGFDHTLDMAVHRTYVSESPDGGVVSVTAFGYSLTTADGGSHMMVSTPGAALDANGDPISYETIDGTGYRLVLDTTGSLGPAAVVTDRHGNRFSMPTWKSNCHTTFGNGLAGSTIIMTCTQASKLATVTDVHGNVLTFTSATGPLDTMGRTTLGTTSVVPTTDLSGCVSNTWPLVSAELRSYATFGGATNQIKVCYANVTLQTAFAQLNSAGTGFIVEAQNAPGVPSPFLSPQIVTLIMPDGSKWTIDYDSYGFVTHLGLPLGGFIDYAWTTVDSLSNCTDQTHKSRAVIARTINDGNGNAYHWTYTWGAINGAVLSNVVGDPLANETVHTFTALDGVGGCNLYETQTQNFQGTRTAGQLLQQVDKTYSVGSVFDPQGNGGLGNVFAATIKTTLQPSGKIKLVQRTPDAGLGVGAPFFNLVTKELIYDWGQGAPGPLLRETDTTYQWQADSRYLDAHILEAPATVIVKDGNGNQLSRTDYTYDEPAYLQTYTGALPAGTRAAAPNPVRGNGTSTSRWLNTSTSPVISHNAWFDTGAMAQAVDPLGHTTSYSQDPVYAGTYVTKTCNALNQCVSGTYDFANGMLTHYTDENAATQASGNTPGDPAHTYTYTYDFLSRMTSAVFPDGGQMIFTYPSPNEVDRQKRVNATTTETSVLIVDGLGRVTRKQHNMPSGAAKIDTVYDGLDRVVSQTNPYFSTADATYGVIQTQFDALGRATRSIKQDNAAMTTDYSGGNCVTTSDEAGNQRIQCSDSLNRLITVLEPGDALSGSAAGGSLTVNGTLQSVTTSGTPATPATGTVTISGGEKSITTTTQPATPATLTVTVGGADGSNTLSSTTCTGVPPNQKCKTVTSTVPDGGNMQFSVNAGGTVITSAQVPYSGSSTPASLASGLAGAFPANALVNLSYTSGSASFTLTTVATGVAANSTMLATSIASTCVDSSSDASSLTCGAQGWTITPGQNFTGGTNAITSTTYDTGTVTITVNGHANQVAYGQNDTASTIAANLVTSINADAAAFVTAAASAGTVTLTSKSTGTAANLPLSVSNTFDSTHFSAQGPSFTGSSPAALSGGTNAVGGTTFTDAGTVTLTVGSFTASAPYGASPGNNTAALVASALVGTGSTGLNRTGSPVTASANGAVISMSYKTVGSAGNVAVTFSGTSNDPAHFPVASFSSPATSLTSGVDPAPPSLSRPYTTQYAYDALGNLICAVQKGSDTSAFTSCASAPAAWRPRAFTYDSLSRLLTSSNPETGQLTFAYNNDNVLTTRTDAMGVTVNYSPSASPVDALHRITQKTYSNGDPAENFVYDQGANAVGRLTKESMGTTSTSLTYDSMGRPLTVTSCTPATGLISGCYVTQMAYDLAGNMVQMTYPSTRVVTYGFNAGNQMNQLQFAKWAGSTVGLNYVTVADTNFDASSRPKSITLGNGVVETAQFNPREQMQEDTISLPGVATLADHIYNYTNSSKANNGAVLSVTDNLNAARSQFYSYDPLNRLTSATEGRWGLSFTYDPWGNRLQQNVTAGTANQVQITVDANNRIHGAAPGCTSATAYCYDLDGRLLNDGFHQYVFDGESRISQVDAGKARYTYDAASNRVRKDVTGSPSTEYVYLGTGVIAEKNITTGDWTDYILAGGRKVAQAFSYENRIRVSGSASCSSCSGQSATFTAPNAAGLGSYTIKSGDKLYLRQTVTGNIKAGMDLTFAGGATGTSLALKDQNAQPIAADGQGLNGAWHNRIIDLTPALGKTVSSVAYKVQPAGSGSWTGMFNDVALVSSDGTVFPIFSQQGTVSLTVTATSSITGATSQVNRDAAAGPKIYSVHYYHGDQVSSSRLLTSGQGWPVWQGTFLPFGEEYNPQASSNNYKFQGKELDTESNLTNFGARYYGSSLGRWLTPDWAPTPVAVPYSDLSAPQSLNLYSFARNCPTTCVDVDGHDDDKDKKQKVKPQTSVTVKNVEVRGEIKLQGGGTIVMVHLEVESTNEVANADGSKSEVTSTSFIDASIHFSSDGSVAGMLYSADTYSISTNLSTGEKSVPRGGVEHHEGSTGAAGARPIAKLTIGNLTAYQGSFGNRPIGAFENYYKTAEEDPWGYALAAADIAHGVLGAEHIGPAAVVSVAAGFGHANDVANNPNVPTVIWTGPTIAPTAPK